MHGDGNGYLIFDSISRFFLKIILSLHLYWGNVEWTCSWLYTLTQYVTSAFMFVHLIIEKECLHSVVITCQSNPPISQFISPCNEFTSVWSMFIHTTLLDWNIH